MSQAGAESPLRSVSDTARWVAVYRALETERSDSRFRDPYARRLAGERGRRIAESMPFAGKAAWSFTARTWLFDRFISDQVDRGAGLVVNLAAGLDARPYRLPLPSSLLWVEVDLPEILDYKAAVLRGETPACRLERVNLDLSDGEARRRIFAQLGSGAKRALVVSEGLLIYLDPEAVESLARDLAAPESFRNWLVDLASPALLRMLKKKMGSPLDQAGAPLKFAPPEGPAFFASRGWEVRDTASTLHAAARLDRLPFFLRLVARLTPPRFSATRPWSGACLLEKQA